MISWLLLHADSTSVLLISSRVNLPLKAVFQFVLTDGCKYPQERFQKEFLFRKLTYVFQNKDSTYVNQRKKDK